MARITWFGHSCFRVETMGQNILIDPFFPPGGGYTWQDAGKIDLVLVTHDHGDHVGDTVAICAKWQASVGCMVGTAQALIKKGVAERLILNGIGFNIGGTLDYNGVRVTMTQAFHSSDSGAPAGYILRLEDGPVIYHAGDTGIFSSMRLLGELYGIGIAMLPIGGVFTMDAYQAAAAAELIKADIVIPMHWGTFPVLAQSPDEFCKDLGVRAPSCRCEVMPKGQPVEFSR